MLAPCLQGMLWFFSLGLALFLLFQLLFLYGVLSEKPIPLPGRILSLVEEQIEEALPEAVVEIQSLSIQADGTLLAGGIEVFLESSPEPVATLEKTMIDLSLPMLFIGRIVPDRIQLQNGELFCPVIFSPSGQRERVIRGFSTSLNIRQNRLTLHHFKCRALDIPITGQGSWYYPIPFLEGSEAELMESSSPLLLAAAGLGQLLKMKPQAEWLEQPSLHFQLTQSEPGKPRLHLTTQAERMILNQKYESVDFRASMELLWESGWQLPEGIRLSGNSLKTTGWPELHGFEVLIQVPSPVLLNPAALTRLEARIAVAEVIWEEIPLGPMLARGVPYNLHTLDFSLQARPGSSPVAVAGRADFQDQAGQVRVRTRDLKLSAWQDLLSRWAAPLPESLVLPEGLSANMSIDFQSGWNPRSVEFDLLAKNSAYQGQNIPEIQAGGSFQVPRGDLQIRKFRTDFPQGYLEGHGSFSQTTLQLKLDVSSEGFLPTQLNPMLPPWWSKIYENIRFDGRLPGGNFYVENDFSKQHTLFIFGRTDFYDGTYSGLDFEEGSMRLLVQPALIDIFDLEAYRDGTFTGGSITWVYDATIKGLKSLNWNIQSEVPPRDGKRLFPEKIQAFFEQFSVSGSSQVFSTGKLFNENEVPDLVDQNQVLISGTSRDPLTYLGYPLDSLDFQADLNPEALRIILNSVGVAGGEGSGWILNQFRQDQPDLLDFDISLLGSERNRLLTLAREFNQPEAPSDIPRPHAENPSLENSGGGTLDIRLKAQGPLGDIYGFSGEGFFELRDPNLGRIRLLGGLSTALEETILPFGTLALNKMASGIVLDRELVQFPSMRITGPITRIKADGDYSLLEKDLNFDVQVFLGNPEESALLTMVTSVLRPITYALELNLAGTLQDPTWKFAHAPGTVRKLRDRSLPDQIQDVTETPTNRDLFPPDSNEHPPYPPPP